MNQALAIKKLILLLRLSLLEFRNRFTVFFNVMLILVLGNLAPIIVSSLKTSTDLFLQNRSREILSADLSVSGISAFSEAQIGRLKDQIQPIQTASEIQFLTMARSSQNTMLVEVKAVDEFYPLYGSLKLFGQIDSANTQELRNTNIAWVQPDILSLLKIKIGDHIQIGKADFIVKAQVQSDSVLPQSSMSFAPRIYIGKNFVPQTSLSLYGSQIFHRLYYQLKDPQKAEALGQSLKKLFKDPNIYIRSPHDAIEGFSRFLDFFSRYLSVMTLIVFCIAWVSAFYIFQSLNQDHLKHSAIIMALGGSRVMLTGVYLLQSFFLSTVSFLASLVISFLTLKFLQLNFLSHLPEGFEFHVFAGDLSRIFCVSWLTSFCFVFILVMKISRLNIQILLGESNQSSEKTPVLDLAVLYFFILTLFVSLAYFLIGLEVFAVGFVLGLILSSAISLSFGRFIFYLFKKVCAARPGMMRVLATNLSRVRFAQGLCFMAIALIALVLNIVPHLMNSLKEDISPVQNHDLPSLFLFNIPEERLDALKAFAFQNNKQLNFLSPLILARLTAINSQPPQNDFFLKYPVRVSYRGELIGSEKIAEGEPLPKRVREDEPAYISLEQGFADRWGIHLHDHLEFDVAGINFKAEVKNFRRVRWSDFNPNFYFEFQPGILDDAPKTWLANVKLETENSIGDGTDEKAATNFESQLFALFPDISVIDVRKSVQQITQIVNALILPAQTLAAVASVICLFILGFVIWQHLLSRTQEIEIVKILGTNPAQVSLLFVLEYLMLGLCAMFVGSLSGMTITYYVCMKFLKLNAVFSWRELLGSNIALFLVLLVVSSILVTRIMRKKGRATTI